MEALSPTMEEGQIVQWLKNEGDSVAEGDVIAEIETDKATMELVARGAGVLRKQLLGAGTSAPVGALIGVIAAADEDVSALIGGAGAGTGGGGASAAPSAAKPATSDAGTAPTDRGVEDRMERQSQASSGSGRPTTAEDAAEGSSVAATPGPRDAAAPKAPARPQPPASQPAANGGDGGRVKASPLARRLAADAGVDLAGVSGSGPGGRIVKRDVEAASTGGGRPAEAGATASGGAAPPMRAAAVAGGVEEIRISQMRKTIAKRLVESIGPVPTFYLTIEVDMTRMTAMRESLNDRLKESGAKVSVNDLIIKATASALRRHPEINAAWGGEVIRRYHNVDIGVAVAVEDGLITPVVRNADQKGAAEIGTEVRELAGRAREKKLQPDEYTGATFSISNLGMFGIDEFTAIINPPEAAILAIGRAEEKPVFVNGRVVAQPRMRITMSCDHRVIDGATGAKFLQTLRALLEEPMMMIA